MSKDTPPVDDANVCKLGGGSDAYEYDARTTEHDGTKNRGGDATVMHVVHSTRLKGLRSSYRTANKNHYGQVCLVTPAVIRLSCSRGSIP